MSKAYLQLNPRHIRISWAPASAPPPPPPPPPPPSGSRYMQFPHMRVRAIQRWNNKSATWAVDEPWSQTHYDDIDGESLTLHPTQLTVQMYAFLVMSEINGENDFTASGGGGTWSGPTDNGYSAAMWPNFADNYAASHGYSPEDNWLHALNGSANAQAGILSISAGGALLFSFLGGGYIDSFVYHVGQTIVLTGLTVGNGSYVIASLQKFGVTLTGWSAGALGPAPLYGKIGNSYITGDGTQTATNRKFIWGWQSWTSYINPSNTNSQAMHVDRFATFINKSAGVPQVNAILIDSMDEESYGQARLQSVEYATSGWCTYADPVVCQYVIDIGTILTAIRTRLGPNFYLRPNTTQYVFVNDAYIDRMAGGMHGERLLACNMNGLGYLDYIVARVAEGIDCEYTNGDDWLIVGGVPTDTSVPASANSGSYSSKTARWQMAHYCTYLMAVDANFVDPVDGVTKKHCIFCNDNGFPVGMGPLSEMWCLGFEYNIGQPTGPYTKTFKTDPAGQSVWTLTRTFSLDGGATTSAFVIMNANPGGQNNYGDNSLTSTTLPTPPSGKAWYLLNDDKTFSASSYTSISSRRAEGLIMVAL